MYARTTIVRGDPRAMDEGIAHVRDVVWPAVQQMSGCVGMSMLADRDAGRCIVTAAWATDEAMRASAATVRDMRSQAAEVMRADAVDVAEWEIAILHRKEQPGDDACVRVIWTDADPDRMGDTIDTFRMSLLPRMDDLPGFCSVSLMVDRGMGKAVTAVTYADRDALERSRDPGKALRDEFTRAMGSEITEIGEFDLVLHHLRVPEMA
jgi:hypothetical protein